MANEKSGEVKSQGKPARPTTDIVEQAQKSDQLNEENKK